MREPRTCRFGISSSSCLEILFWPKLFVWIHEKTNDVVLSFVPCFNFCSISVFSGCAHCCHSHLGVSPIIAILFSLTRRKFGREGWTEKFEENSFLHRFGFWVLRRKPNRTERCHVKNGHEQPVKGPRGLTVACIRRETQTCAPIFGWENGKGSWLFLVC